MRGPNPLKAASHLELPVAALAPPSFPNPTGINDSLSWPQEATAPQEQ